MKIYDFDVEDGILKVEKNLANIEILRNSFADYTAKYREFSRSINLDFRVLSDCIESYERALLIGVYTYAEQLVKNFYYELLEKDRMEKSCWNHFINKKLDVEKFSPNVKYDLLQTNIKNELFPEFQFIIKKEREEISKYNDIIKDRHRYAHRGIYQSNFDQYRDVINVEKFITIELEMIVDKQNGMKYRIDYQDDWKNIGDLLRECHDLYKQFEGNSPRLRRKLIQKTKSLREKSRRFYSKYHFYIDRCILLEDVKNQLLELNNIDLRKKESFLIIENLTIEIKRSKLFIAK